MLVGKTNLHEFAFGTTTDNPHHGPCRNPWDPARSPGGSSGGSGAALAAGHVRGLARHGHRRLDPHPGRRPAAWRGSSPRWGG